MSWLTNVLKSGARPMVLLRVLVILGVLLVLGGQALGVNPPEALVLKLCGS